MLRRMWHNVNEITHLFTRPLHLKHQQNGPKCTELSEVDHQVEMD